jgi:tetratricopeptide (TPR) repeat protein
MSKADALHLLGRNADALACCEQALKIDSSWAAAWRFKGNCLNELGREEEAQECFQRSAEQGDAMAQ